jgi:Uma2 family endonuclease
MGCMAVPRLGDPITLADLLAMPPDGGRYARDIEGRLCQADRAEHHQHRRPLARLLRRFCRSLPESWEIVPQGGVAFPALQHLQGGLVPASRFRVQSLEPDIAVFDRRAEVALGTQGAAVTTTGLRLIVEILAASSWHSDLGVGDADAVDRWRTYLAAGVPELWVLNVGVVGAPLPPGAGLFVKNAGTAWTPLGGRDLVLGAGLIHGNSPVTAGVVRSEALSTDLDVGALWTELA